MATDYRVELETFEGPMDLLLYLIRKAEVEVADIPIAAITDQYLGYLEHIERVDIDLAGEFLVTAATLMEIKSRMIRPPDEQGEVGESEAVDVEDGVDPGDPRAELVRQLLDYKKFRDAGEALETRRQSWQRRFPNAPAGIDDERVRTAMDEMGELELEDLDLGDLFEAFQGIVASVNFERIGDHEVIADDTPIELHAEDIVDRLRRQVPLAGAQSGAQGGRSLSMRGLFAGRTHAEMVGLFLALLTLVRDQKVGVRPGEDGVLLELREEEEVRGDH